MNRVLSILILLCAFVATTMAVDYQTYKPQSQQYQGAVYSTAEAAQGNVQNTQNTQNATFSSTSAYSKQLEENASRPVNPMINVQTDRAYTIPVAATGITGGVTTEDGKVIHRIGHRPDPSVDPEEPPANDEMPIGDTPWLWMVLLALGYTAFRVYRFRNSGVQED